MKKNILFILGIFLILFGLLTIFVGSSVLFDWFGIRSLEGHFVPLVVWANVICGFLYLFAAYGIFKSKEWVTKLLLTTSLLLVLTLAYLYIHILTGGVYERQVLFALPFRTLITLLFAFVSYYFSKKS